MSRVRDLQDRLSIIASLQRRVARQREVLVQSLHLANDGKLDEIVQFVTRTDDTVVTMGEHLKKLYDQTSRALLLARSIELRHQRDLLAKLG